MCVWTAELTHQRRGEGAELCVELFEGGERKCTILRDKRGQLVLATSGKEGARVPLDWLGVITAEARRTLR